MNRINSNGRNASVKKLLAALVMFMYLVLAYLLLASYVVSENILFDLSRSLQIPIILMLVVCILVIGNIILAIILVKRSKTLSFKYVAILKLMLIPYYMLNFFLWLTIAIMAIPLIPFVVVYTYFTMIGTSTCIIAKLLFLRRSNVIKTNQFVFHCILQLVFMLDVIDSIYLFKREKEFDDMIESQLR